MAQGFDHFCSGNNCIFCKCFPIGKTAKDLIGLDAVHAHQAFEDNSLESHMLYSQAPREIYQDEEHAKLEKLAFNDPLTGLFNVHVFLRELKKEIARTNRYKRPLTLLTLRLDDFEEIKTKYGPLGRELVLKHVGKLLNDLLRDTDSAFRLQDDQFALILAETNEAGGKMVGKRIRESLLKKPVKVNSLILPISPSIGLATCPKHGQDSETLLNSCFTAQAQAFSGGGNAVLTL